MSVPSAPSQTPARSRGGGDQTALSVHGPAGVIDLTVPSGATLTDVTRAYSVETSRGDLLPLVDRAGRALPMTSSVAAAGLRSGAVVVAVDPTPRAPREGRRRAERPAAGARTGLPPAAAVVVLVLAGVASVVAGALAASLPDAQRRPVAAVLLAAAVLACVPAGAHATRRVLVAPAFGAGGVLALLLDTDPDRLPVLVGTAVLGAAVTAALGRALAEPDAGADEGLRTWLAVGATWFALAGLAALVGVAPSAVWALLVVLAALASRFVPEVAVDVPDSYLLDLERLAVTAWSARERPTGRRGRAMVAEQAVAVVAARGARTVTAAAAAVLVVLVVAVPALLLTAGGPVDSIGARVLVGASGGVLLLAARTYRHTAARALLRAAGAGSLVWLAGVLLGVLPAEGGSMAGRATTLAVIAVVVALALVVTAVRVGRGWRSARWSRRAEIAESVLGSVAVGSLVVAVGLFRHLWEVTG